MKKHLIALTALFISFQAWTCDEHGVSGFAPDNDRYIPTFMNKMANITEAQFNDILDRVEDFATTQVASVGGNLVVHRLWTDGTVNASADRNDGNYNLNMYGGLARHPLMSPEGFAMVACHELGHHIGGAPKKKILWFTMWASNEGQADYYASTKCMRRYFELDNNRAIADTLELPEEIIDNCAAEYSDDNQRAICERIAAAGFDLARVLYDLKNEGDPNYPHFDTPDANVVSTTNHEHPEAQCRLDTYYQGALCPKSEFIDPSDTDPKVGFCSRAAHDTAGLRPLCWFNPNSF